MFYATKFDVVSGMQDHSLFSYSDVSYTIVVSKWLSINSHDTFLRFFAFLPLNGLMKFAVFVFCRVRWCADKLILKVVLISGINRQICGGVNV